MNAGTYTGKILLKHSDGEFSIPLEVKVLDFRFRHVRYFVQTFFTGQILHQDITNKSGITLQTKRYGSYMIKHSRYVGLTNSP